jgi:hypothetical protein
MSLIKWRPNMEAIENALSVVKKQDVVQQQPISTPAIIDRVFHVRPTTEMAPRYTSLDSSLSRPYGEANVPVIRDQVELPRMCASRRMLWMARYIRVAGKWKFSCGVQVDPQTHRLLYDTRVHDTVEFSSYSSDYETCAHCGVAGWGGIHCNSCHAFTCHGTVYRSGSHDWGRCVCGRDGILERRDHVQTAIYPKARAR